MKINVFIKRRETCDLLFALGNVFFVDFYNDTTKKFRSVHSPHHEVSNYYTIDQ